MNQPSHAIAAVDVGRVLVVANDETSLQRTEHAYAKRDSPSPRSADEQLALRSLGPEIDLIVVTDGSQLDARGLCTAIRARSRLPIVMSALAAPRTTSCARSTRRRRLFGRAPGAPDTRRARFGGSAPLRCPRPRGRRAWGHGARRRGAALLHGDAELGLTLLETGVLRALLARRVAS